MWNAEEPGSQDQDPANGCCEMQVKLPLLHYVLRKLQLSHPVCKSRSFYPHRK